MPSRGPTSTRLVPMTREQRDWLNGKDLVEGILNGIPVHIVAAWDAAPADPAEAIAHALYLNTWGEEPDDVSDLALDRVKAQAVLACLGYALPRNEDRA